MRTCVRVFVRVCLCAASVLCMTKQSVQANVHPSFLLKLGCNREANAASPMHEERDANPIPADNIDFGCRCFAAGTGGRDSGPEGGWRWRMERKPIYVLQVFLNENKMCMKVERTIYPQEEIVSKTCSHSFKECSHNL